MFREVLKRSAPLVSTTRGFLIILRKQWKLIFAYPKIFIASLNPGVSTQGFSLNPGHMPLYRIILCALAVVAVIIILSIASYKNKRNKQ